MSSTKEGTTPQPTLSGWVDSTISSFRSRNLDNSGFNAWQLGHAVLQVLEGTGLEAKDMVDIALKTSCCDVEYRQRLRQESEGSKNPDLIFAARLILAEIDHLRPEVTAENEAKIELYRPHI
jgi:hypothetical protein